MRQEYKSEAGPDLGAFRLFSPTGSRKFRGSTFCKAIFSGSSKLWSMKEK